ncbi:MAG: zinc ribbon domain-containing protein [Deltaproteobacteria bacterium]|nr:zinc ribbon domain-containing protein [Deltaproteobacteria bacterium]
MPIYEYKCKKCGKEFEMFQGIADPAAKSCKFCKGQVHKLLSVSSFHLKGSGWYATDYGGKKAPAAEKKPEEGKSTEKTEKSETPATAKTEE